jgi:glycosyltransferase involved in cell wall biosynthesis
MSELIVSIGMPVFNDVDFIEESIVCILNQSFQNFELIISDDGSTDGSEAICRKYADIDTRVRYFKQPENLGISKNMEWLLNKSSLKYFMWAGDDDIMNESYIETLLTNLKNNPHCVSAFATCYLIDENNDPMSKPLKFDYSNDNIDQRLKYFIKNATDYFGYGLFVRERIKDVKFPVWKWPNKNTPYNNIYPTLAYYLCQGDFIFCHEGAIFSKRIKPSSKENHKLIGKNSAAKESFAYWIRKLNLVGFTAKLIRKSKGSWFMLKLYPRLFYHWFLVPSIEQLRLVITSFWNNRVIKKRTL